MIELVCFPFIVQIFINNTLRMYYPYMPGVSDRVIVIG